MNYRHAFHAGSFADVHKHALLIGLLRLLQKKETPLCYFDTHAGQGFYDLSRSPAQRTLEFRSGIGPLMKAARVNHPWLEDRLQAVRDLRKAQGNVELYPGSPALAYALQRPQDRSVLMELHPEDVATLKTWAHRRAHVEVHWRDAYEGIPALVPPREHRGLVLIDPPYEEERDDWKSLQSLLQAVIRRWPIGVFALWYPIKQQSQVDRFIKTILQRGMPGFVTCELSIQPTDTPLGLNGSGMMVFNPPWTFADEAARCQQELWSRLSPDGRGRHQVRHWQPSNPD